MIKKNKEKDWIKKYFSNRFAIIDEAHNIRDDQGKDMARCCKNYRRSYKI